MLNELAKEIHENAVNHGWGKTDFPTTAAMCHCEISEAVTEWQNNRLPEWHECMVWGMPCISPHCSIECGNPCAQRSPKPEGIAVEMADCLIRILGWFGQEGIDADRIVAEKMNYNRTREYRHGGKKA